MDILRQQFFSLLQAGLWNRPADTAPFDTPPDWEAIYRAARAQALLGIVMDGLQTLPPRLRPPRPLYLRWCSTLLTVEENNQRLNRELANLYTLCRNNGIEPVLLKGQGVAQCYPNPLHRQCGDIDLYTGTRHYDLLNSLLLPDVTAVNEECFKHTGYTWHGIAVENHRVICTLNAPAADRRFQADIRRWSTTDRSTLRSVTIGDCTATLPPLTFDAAYLLVHSVLHALNEGIGLRQVCDWAVLLHTCRDRLDLPAVAHLIRSYGLARAARIFGAVCVHYLGLPPASLPIPYYNKDIPTARWLMDDIWRNGNFGQYDTDRTPRPRGYWRGKLYTITRLTARCRKMHRLSPAEARWYPLVVALHSLTMQLKKRL